jgi:hypothetical protein
MECVPAFAKFACAPFHSEADKLLTNAEADGLLTNGGRGALRRPTGGALGEHRRGDHARREPRRSENGPCSRCLRLPLSAGSTGAVDQ